MSEYPLEVAEPSWSLLRQMFERTQRSDAWRDVGLWAVGRLEEHLGGSWAHHVFASQDPLTNRLALAPFHTQAFARLLELALRIELTANLPGRSTLTKDLERDRRLSRLVHTEITLEVIALADELGMRVAAEVSNLRNPVDIELGWEEIKIPVEALAVLTDASFRHVQVPTDHLHDVALRASRLVEAQVELDLKRMPSGHSEIERVIEELAEEARRADGFAGRDVDFGRITVDTRSGFVPPTMSGPLTSRDGWQRVHQKLHEKALKAYSERPVWLRVDVLDGLWQFTPWARLDLPSKLRVMSNQVHADPASMGSLAGIVLTSGALWAQGIFANDTSVDTATGGIALRRLLPIDRVRETMIIPIHPQLPNETKLWHSVYDSEPAWLDRSLARLGLPDTGMILGSQRRRSV